MCLSTGEKLGGQHEGGTGHAQTEHSPSVPALALWSPRKQILADREDPWLQPPLGQQIGGHTASSQQRWVLVPIQLLDNGISIKHVTFRQSTLVPTLLKGVDGMAEALRSWNLGEGEAF